MSAQLSLRLDLWPDLFAHRPSALHLVAALGTAVFICNAREAREWARETIAGDNVREPHSFSWRSRARGTGQRCPRRLTGSQATGAARTAASSLSDSPCRREREEGSKPKPGASNAAKTDAGRKRSYIRSFLFFSPRTSEKELFLSFYICASHCQSEKNERWHEGRCENWSRGIGEKLRREVGSGTPEGGRRLARHSSP